jgi:hypothetical protein
MSSRIEPWLWLKLLYPPALSLASRIWALLS